MAFQDLIRYGVNTQQTNASLGQAAAEGFEAGQKRVREAADRAYLESERKRVADEREQKELDAFYGELYVPPTGQQSYDAGVEMMAREWKAEFAALRAAKNSGQIGNDEWVSGQHEIRNRARELKAGQEALNQAFLEYNKGVEEGQISNSTPAKVRLFYQAMEDGTVSIQNVNGRPTLVGEVADGEPVQIDMAALASGQAGLKFNQKVDTPGLINTVAKTLEGYKTTVATENGLALGNVGWEQIQERAAHDIDQILNNQSTIEAIAADELGYNHEEIVALGEEETKNVVGDYLLDRLEREYFPVANVSAPLGTLSLNQQKFDHAVANPQAQTGGQPNASLLRFGQEQADIQQTRQIFNNAIQTGDYRQLIGRGPILNAKPPGFFSGTFGTGAWTIETKGGNIKIDPNNPGDQQILANLLGLGNTQQSSSTGGSSSGGDYTQYLDSDTPVKRRPPTREELKKLHKKGLKGGVPGFDNLSGELEGGIRDYASRGIDFLGGNPYSVITDEELNKLHLPGTNPTSKEEKASIYDFLINEGYNPEQAKEHSEKGLHGKHGEKYRKALGLDNPYRN